MNNKIIVISGIDGSGKSTIIDGLEKLLTDRGYSTHKPWLRYNHYSTKGVFAIAKLLGLYDYEIRNGKRALGYHEFYRSRLISLMFIISTFVDTLFASIVKVYLPAYLLGKVVICDRWTPDILVDIANDTSRENNGLAKNLTWKAFWRLVPKSAITFVVLRNFDQVLDCREENQLDRNFRKKYDMYNELCRLGDCHPINNDGTIDEATRRISEIALGDGNVEA